MKFDVIRLNFSSPLHLSNERSDYASSTRVLHSDTLHAAIMHTWSLLGWKIPEDGDPGFTISSAFPFMQDREGSCTYFFPKPMLRLPYTKDLSEVSGLSKKIKQVKWLDKDYLEKYLNQSSIDSFGEKFEDLQGSYLVQNKKVAGFPGQEGTKSPFPLLTSLLSPRNKVSRLGGDTEIFYVERLVFKPYAGLYCIIQCKDDKIRQNVLTILEVLGEEGIGTDRSVGNGRFTPTYQKEAVHLEVPDQAAYALNLSLYCPESSEQLQPLLGEEGDSTAYGLIKRGGYISDPRFKTLKKQDLFMFQEGSVFKLDTGGKEVELGAIKDLQPQIFNELALKDSEKHPIWRVGKALFIPCNPK